MTNEQRIERKERTLIIRRNHVALRQAKVNVSINKAQDDEAFNKKLMNCKTQASVIQLCVENNKAKSFLTDLLVKQALCKSEDHAIARLKRHKNYDTASRIVSRSMLINN